MTLEEIKEQKGEMTEEQLYVELGKAYLAWSTSVPTTTLNKAIIDEVKAELSLRAE
jgi:hypothetical protein